MDRHRRLPCRSGFTIVEVLAVLGVIALLAGMLFPALLRARSAAMKATSMSHMRQIHLWMQLYAEDNDDIILPSQFNYAGDPYRGHVRTVPEFQTGLELSLGPDHQGTWADIIWTENELGFASGFEAALKTGEATGYSYVYDSPDDVLYHYADGSFENPLRSAAAITRNTPDQDIELVDPDLLVARPYGIGAREIGQPGYFAANNWFAAASVCSATPEACRWSTNTRLRVPDRTMYLVDSVSGEIISPSWRAFFNEDPRKRKLGDNTGPIGLEPLTNEVDFRYGNSCLMLIMDGHIVSVGEFINLDDLQQNKRINVTDPLSSTPPPVKDG